MIHKFNLWISVKVGPICAKKKKKKSELCKYKTLIHMDDFCKLYNHMTAERASVRETLKLLTHKWFGMWMEEGAEQITEWREIVEEAEGWGGEPAGYVPRVRIQLQAQWCVWRLSLGLSMEQFHASAAEKSTKKQEANKETESRWFSALAELFFPQTQVCLKGVRLYQCVHCMNLCIHLSVFYMCVSAYECFQIFF